MSELKPCPCGQTPERVDVYDAHQGGKWGLVVPSCCGEWMIEFRTHYEQLGTDALLQHAAEAWNNAPREQERESRGGEG